MSEPLQLVVVKVGSSSLTDDRGAFNVDALTALSQAVADARKGGHRICVVTSGAVAAGVAAMGLPRRPADVGTLQALSAIGQSRLMEQWNRALAVHGLVGAQVLLVPHDFFDRRQYLHARTTLLRLLELGVVPLINENDAIADDEIRFGDNDRMAALVAQSINADRLVLLTDTAGLFTADPRHDPAATLIERVEPADDLAVDVRGAGTARGSGGMASKLIAARMAAWAGVTAVIAKADRRGVLGDALLETAGVGTVFVPHERRLSARKVWLAFAVETVGSVTVDDGARVAVTERGRSLLPAGVVSVSGPFEKWDPIEILDGHGNVFARGLVGIDSATLSAVAGSHTASLPDGVPHEVVHRDDLVVIDR